MYIYIYIYTKDIYVYIYIWILIINIYIYIIFFEGLGRISKASQWRTLKRKFWRALMAPPRGLSTPRALKVKIKTKKEMVAKYAFFVRICTIFCIREAVYISYGSRIPPRPLKRHKNFNLLSTIFQFVIFGITFGGAFGLWLQVPCRGHGHSVGGRVGE